MCVWPGKLPGTCYMFGKDLKPRLCWQVSQIFSKNQDVSKNGQDKFNVTTTACFQGFIRTIGTRKYFMEKMYKYHAFCYDRTIKISVHSIIQMLQNLYFLVIILSPQVVHRGSNSTEQIFSIQLCLRFLFVVVKLICQAVSHIPKCYYCSICSCKWKNDPKKYFLRVKIKFFLGVQCKKFLFRKSLAKQLTRQVNRSNKSCRSEIRSAIGMCGRPSKKLSYSLFVQLPRTPFQPNPAPRQKMDH